MTSRDPQAVQLQRSLSYRDLILYGLAYIAPFAPLSTLGFVWTASNGLIVLAYVLGAVCMYFTAKSYAIMTQAVPSAGSVYGFARFALGTLPGFLAGWLILLDYLLIPAFLYGLIAVAVSTLMPGVDRSVWIVLLVASTLAINWFGIAVTARANFIAVGLQVLVLAGFVALALVALHAGKGNGALTLAPVFSAAKFDVAHLLAGTSICIMSFLGFDAISTLSEEVRDRDRHRVGHAIMAVLVIAAAFFVVVTWVLGNLLPGMVIHDPSAAAYELAGWAIGPWAATVLAWTFALVVGVSNALPMQVGVARVLFAMGRDRQLPASLARVHPRYHTPYVGMVVTAAVSLLVALAMRDRLDDLATIVNLGALGGFLLLHVSVLKHFIIRGKSRRWMVHGLVPVCGILVVLAVMSGMSALALKVGAVWLAAGLLYGLVLRSKRRAELNAPL